jgi:hypothetical protein
VVSVCGRPYTASSSSVSGTVIRSTIQHVKNTVVGATRDGRHHGTPGQPEWKTWTLDRRARWSAEFGLRNLRSTYATEARLPPTRHLRAL